MTKKILIVDDETHIRILMEENLLELADEHAVEILTARDGEEGLRTVREETPELVFLDVMMPKMNGYAVCKAIRAQPELGGVYVILLTAKGQLADLNEGRIAGANEYLTKPFDPDLVLEKAKSVLGL